MKQFNIAKAHYVINGTHLPINSCYGKFISTYRKYIGTRQIYTKRGKVVDKPQFEIVTEEIVYYIDNFRACKNYGEENYLAYRIHVWDSCSEKWINTNTQKLAKYKPLGEFLEKMFEKNNIKPTTECIPWIDGLHKSAPTEKKAQVYSDNPFRAVGAYVLSKNVMTCHNINRDGWYYDNGTKSRRNCL